MKKDDLRTLIIDCLKEVITEMEEIDLSQMETIDESTRLIGKESVLSSINLVSMLVDVEQRLEEDFGITLTIADERAMSQEKSPFLTVESLSSYLSMLIKEIV
jgi:hypothetical protein